MKNGLLQKKRMTAVQKALSSSAGYLFEDPHDLFYLTGLRLSQGMLLITKKEITLYVDSRYKEMACKQGVCLVKILPGKGKKEALRVATKTIQFDPQATSYARYTELTTLFPCSLKPSPSFFEQLRSIKGREEIKWMEKSAQVLWEGVCHVRSLLKIGITEEEIAKQLLLFCIEKGAEGWAFSPNVSFGKNSALPHHRASKSKLKKGDIVLIDVGVIYEQYCSDMTRTFFFGPPSSELSSLFDIVHLAYETVLPFLRPGTKIGKLDHVVRQVFKEKGVEELFIHALGHGIGLQVHEFPRIREKGQDHDALLKEGMVLCIEPGLYLPGKGGVRYENTVVITQNGHKNFYPFDNK